MKVITPFSNKGGVGRTTLSYNIASRFAQMGYTTVFIDADGQANGTYALGLSKEPCVYNLLVRPQNEGQWQNVLRRTAVENLWVVPGNEETFNIADRIKETAFMRRLQQIQDWADFVVFDLSPSFTKIHQAAVNAADYIIIPTDPEPFGALNGVDRAIEAVGESNEMRDMAGLPVAEILGVVVNKIENNNLHKAIVNALEDKGTPIIEFVPKRVDLAYAAVHHQSIFEYNPDLDAAQKIQNIVDLIANRAKEGTK